MQRILYLIYVAPYCSITVPLVKHYVITKWPLFGILYLYAVWLLRITLSPTL